MVYETSYGIIPLKYLEGVWEVFLVQQKNGNWTLPKGHPEEGETPIETAKRELFEETGLQIKTVLFKSPFIERYHFDRKKHSVDKTVIYFAAEVFGVPFLQDEEIQDAGWFSFEKAFERVTFSEARNLLNQLLAMMTR